MKKAKRLAFILALALGFTMVASTSGCAVAHLPTPTPRGLVIDLLPDE